MPPYLSSPLANFRAIEADIHKYDENEIGFLGCLLQRAPVLENVKLHYPGKEIQFPSNPDDTQYEWFAEKWKCMAKDYDEGKMSEKACDFGFYF